MTVALLGLKVKVRVNRNLTPNFNATLIPIPNAIGLTLILNRGQFTSFFMSSAVISANQGRYVTSLFEVIRKLLMTVVIVTGA